MWKDNKKYNTILQQDGAPPHHAQPVLHVFGCNLWKERLMNDLFDHCLHYCCLAFFSVPVSACILKFNKARLNGWWGMPYGYAGQVRIRSIQIKKHCSGQFAPATILMTISYIIPPGMKQWWPLLSAISLIVIKWWQSLLLAISWLIKPWFELKTTILKVEDNITNMIITKHKERNPIRAETYSKWWM